MRHDLPSLDTVRLTQLATADHGLYALDSDGRLWRYYPNVMDMGKSRWQRVPGPQEESR